ncbi:hypothetical protein Tco_1385429 [Tanacetum coccineum]
MMSSGEGGWFDMDHVGTPFANSSSDHLSVKTQAPSQDTLNRFKVRGFGSLLEAGTKADTKHDIGPTYLVSFPITDKWSLDDLKYGIPRGGPYLTDPPCPDDINNYVQEEREGPVTRIRHKTVVDCHVSSYRSTRAYGMLLTRLFKFVMSEIPELFNESYALYDSVMYPLTAQQEQKTQKDYAIIRGRSSTSSSSAFRQPYSSHPNDDDDDDANDEGTSCASTPSPTRFVNSLTNEVPRVFENPPDIDPNMEHFYARQTDILNRQVKLRDEQHGGLRSIGKGTKNLLKKKKK